MISIIERIKEYTQRRAVRARLRKAVSVLCCLVVFVTTYALVLPGLAIEKKAACGKEEHEHTADCYTRELVCGQEESEEHRHTDDCYEDVLSCGKEVHIHTEDCYPQEEPEEETEEEPEGKISRIGAYAVYERDLYGIGEHDIKRYAESHVGDLPVLAHDITSEGEYE